MGQLLVDRSDTNFGRKVLEYVSLTVIFTMSHSEPVISLFPKSKKIIVSLLFCYPADREPHPSG